MLSSTRSSRRRRRIVSCASSSSHRAVRAISAAGVLWLLLLVLLLLTTPSDGFAPVSSGPRASSALLLLGRTGSQHRTRSPRHGGPKEKQQRGCYHEPSKGGTAPSLTGRPGALILRASLSSSTAHSSSASSSSIASVWKGKSAKKLASVAIWCLLDLAFRQLFLKFYISFPSSLAGCGTVLAVLLALPRAWSEHIVHRRLEPGATLLAQYLPVFFVPSLISLPLADGFGSLAELSKVGIVVAGGFLFTLYTTAASVLAARKAIRHWRGSTNGSSDKDDNEIVNESSSTTTIATTTARFIASSDGQIEQDPLQATSAQADEAAEKNRARPVIFSRRLQRRLVLLTLLSTAAASVASRWIPLHSTERSIRTSLCGISLLSSTLLSFVTSSRLPAKITKRVHPLLFTTAFTWTVAAWLARIGSGSTSFRSVLKYCYRGKASTASALAAGPILLYLLGPAVVSLSVSMYRRRQLIRDNVTEVATAVVVSTLGGLLGTALAVRLLRLANPFLRLSLLSRNITSPLAMAMAGILGADASLAVTMVVITGLLGANFGPSLLDRWGFTDPVARGLGMGAAAHGLGTAALASAGPDEAAAFPFAAIGMALCACAATVAVSVPPVRQLVLQIALGS